MSGGLVTALAVLGETVEGQQQRIRQLEEALHAAAQEIEQLRAGSPLAVNPVGVPTRLGAVDVPAVPDPSVRADDGSAVLAGAGFVGTPAEHGNAESSG